jgi:CheY-like chemotaxis protein
MVGGYGLKSPLLAPDPLSASLSRTGEPSKAPTILLVEDNRSDIFIITEILKQSGLAAGLHVVMDGADALSYWNDESKPCVDLLLLDLNIPKITGLEVLAQIRAGQRCPGVPVIVVTSSKSAEDIAALRALDASAYFQKPNDLAAFMRLGKVVQEILTTR